jgi:hypothetical protein
VQQYNAGVPGVVSSISGPTQVVDIHAAVGTTGIGNDGLHPDPTGYARMADAWLTAIPNDPVPPPPPPPPPPGAGFVSLTPARLLDSRPGGTTVDGQGAGIGYRTAGQVTTLQIAGRGGVPTGATAAVLNLTVTQTGAPGFATIWPCNQPEPNASNLNYTDHDVANAVIAKLDPTGQVCIRTSAPTHLIADVNGWVT